MGVLDTWDLILGLCDFLCECCVFLEIGLVLFMINIQQ
jgi:hypothetical protein